MDAEAVLGLESALLDPAVRLSRDRVLELLDPEFVEFGASGVRWDRDTIVDALQHESTASTLLGSNYEAVQLAADVMLVTYETTGAAGRRTLRSSVWQRRSDGWRMRFHQGTVTR